MNIPEKWQRELVVLGYTIVALFAFIGLYAVIHIVLLGRPENCG